VYKRQLARLLVDAGRVDEAKEVLTAAVQRFPRNARLGVLLAYYQRPQWQTARARVADLLESWSDPEPIRPRARYEGPLDDDQALHDDLMRDLESRRDAARAAIAQWEARLAK